MKQTLSLLVAALLFCAVTAKADYTEAYIICRPNDYINVRLKPSTHSDSIGRYEAGDKILLDGKQSKGFSHAKVSLETNEGWIYSGYIVYDQPTYSGEQYIVVSNGRVACRKYIDGPRRCWVKNKDTVTVWYYSADWCLTNKGFIQTKYLQPAVQDTDTAELHIWNLL